MLAELQCSKKSEQNKEVRHLERQTYSLQAIESAYKNGPERGVGGDDAVEATGLAQSPGDRSGINVGNALHALLLEILVQAELGAVIGHHARQVSHDDARQMYFGRLNIICAANKSLQSRDR